MEIGYWLSSEEHDPKELVENAKRAGGKEPLYGKITGAFAPDVETAKKIGKERQPNTAMGGALSQELALPRDFEAVAELVREDDLEDSLVFGADEGTWRAKLAEYEQAGFTHVCLHNVAKEQQEFVEFAARLR